MPREARKANAFGRRAIEKFPPYVLRQTQGLSSRERVAGVGSSFKSLVQQEKYLADLRDLRPADPPVLGSLPRDRPPPV